MLIDWEDARRDDLPLQDAYHFLHWQDYLFGARPALHSPEVERFAGTIGITATQCRQLEIVYLAEASMECLTQGDWAPAEFLMKALQHRCGPIVARRRSQLPRAMDWTATSAVLPPIRSRSGRALRRHHRAVELRRNTLLRAGRLRK